MRLGRSVLFFFCLLAAMPARADIAGQVLAVVGEALALRAGHIMRLFPGASIESGDQIHTGPDSGVQIRFTDWGFVSLRARTDFVVDDYVYEAQRGGRAKAFFSLLNGGVRSLTGEIGHRDRSAFRLRATTATVGVRGTHFSLLICKQDCRNPDGSLGEDGLYGEVLDGRIAVSPYGGASLEREFSAGESFRLVNENSVPGPLFSPPPFLPDKLDPQARSGGSAAPIASVGGVVPGAGSPAPNLNPLPAVTGNLPGTLVSTLPVSTLKPPLAKTTALVDGAVGSLGSTASDLVITPLANQVLLPAAQLPGSMVNAALSMPALGPVVPLAGSALSAVPAVIAPVSSTLTSILSGLPAVTTPLPPVTLPGLPPVTTLPPVTVPGLPPVTTPLPPVTVPGLPPVTAPTLPPVTTPTLPPVTAPTLPPVTAPTLPP
ncbi:MAG TPA: FecR domain-containing protein, partial [Burkholderiales bacterium]|nr:FecR domain-containing protein [Burkholderiales bacterium]